MDDVSQTPSQDAEIVDAEIVDDAQSPNASDSDQSTVLLSLDEMIKTTFATLDRLNEEQKKIREMLADGLNNDANFKQASDKAKAAAKEKTQIKQQIMNRPGVIEFANKLKDINADIKEKRASLSDYVLEYQRLAGVNQIEVADGEVLEIIQSARLVKKFSK